MLSNAHATLNAVKQLMFALHHDTCRSSKGLATNGYTAAASGVNAAAGGTYSASTLINNWAENRQQNSKRSPSNYRLKQLTGTSCTEYQAAISSPAATREQQLQQCYMGGMRHLSKGSCAILKQAQHVKFTSSVHKSSCRTSTWTDSSCSGFSSTAYISSVTSSDISYISSLSSSGRSRASAEQLSQTATTASGSHQLAVSGKPKCNSIMASALEGHKMEFQQPSVGGKPCV